MTHRFPARRCGILVAHATTCAACGAPWTDENPCPGARSPEEVASENGR